MGTMLRYGGGGGGYYIYHVERGVVYDNMHNMDLEHDWKTQ